MSLRLSNISKKFDEKWILREVNLEVKPGEIFGLLGANGSGKTTLLRLVHGSEKADSGQISFESDVLNGISEKERGFTFSETGSPALWKKLFKSDKNQNISSGEKQEQTFSEELAAVEKVLLLDNPFCCVNEIFREELLENLRQTAKEKNLAVILVTNDYREAFAACDRIGILHQGEIAQTGTPREIYESPATIAVAAALGRNNFIKARRISFNNEQVQEFQTLEGDQRLQVGKTEKRLLGAITDDATLSIRPEHISLSFGASFPEDNLLKAEIIRIQYQGATTLVRLSANGLILESLVLRLVGLNVGDECMVGLPPDRIRVLKN